MSSGIVDLHVTYSVVCSQTVIDRFTLNSRRLLRYLQL